MKITMLWIGAVAALMPAAAAGEPFLHFPGVRIRPITCNFTCYRYNRGRGDLHGAIDYGFADSNEIRAAAGGEVTAVVRNIPRNVRGDGFGYGNHVFVRHENGYVTLYAHLLLETIAVQMDSRVEAGQRIGLSDNSGASTGPHLHFEVRDAQGRRVNPYGDPPDYAGGCGPNALWMTCPPTPAPSPDADGDGVTVAAGDCDDANRDVHPGAAETCNDRDDDCNGTRDDPWRSGLAQDIGNPCTVGIGTCANTGTWICTPDGRATVCNVDPLPPQPESCNGLDDDCDGESDEDWRTGLTQDVGNPCEIFWDACRGTTSGEWTCTPDGYSTVCSAPDPGGRLWEPERYCNAIDDDCDATTVDIPDGLFETSAAHCGGCNRSCGSDGSCVYGACQYCPNDICHNFCRGLCDPRCLTYCPSYPSCYSGCSPNQFSGDRWSSQCYRNCPR